MTSATHGDRERFVAELARACPHASHSIFQRLLRLAFTHSRLISVSTAEAEQITLHKISRIEGKIIEIARELSATAVFNSGPYSVQIIVRGRTLNVPTSNIEESK